MLTGAFIESTMSRTQVQLWYNWFKEVRDADDNACPGSSSTSTTDKNTEAVKRMILSFWLMPSNFYGCFRRETYDSEDCSKIAKF